jgi:hypothetical protein
VTGGGESLTRGGRLATRKNGLGFGVFGLFLRTAQLNWIRLTFDRAVEISGINVAAFYVNDDDSDEAYTGSGAATLVDPQTVQIPMAIVHGATGPGTQLTVGDDSGIVASDDGGTWAGANVLPLPFA